MSNLTKGEVAIHLAGEPHTLKPTLEAFTRIAEIGGYRDLCRRIAAYEVAATAFAIRHGLGWDDKQARALPELLFQTGMTGLAGPVAEYVFKLFNAGMTPDEVAASIAAEAGGADPGKPPGA